MEKTKWTKKRIQEVCDKIQLQFKDEKSKEEWNRFVEINSKDSYSYGVVKYATTWGKCMQYLIEEENYKVAQAAEETEFECDTDGITGFMFGCAINALSKMWKYGEELRVWHNKGYNYDGEGVVNPAVVNIDISND